MLAVGAVPRRLAGSDGGAYVLRTAADAYRLRSALVPGAQVVVVGAGWIGAEVATAAAHRGCAVTVLEAGVAPLVTALGPAAGGRTTPWYAEAGVDPAHRRRRLRRRLPRRRAGRRGPGGGGRGGRGGRRPAAAGLAGRLRDRGRPGQRRGDRGRGGPHHAGPASSRSATAPPAGRRGPTAGCAPSTGTTRCGRRRSRPRACSARPRSYDPVPYVWSEQFGRYLQWVGWRADGPSVWRGDPAARTGWSAAWLDSAGRLTGLLTVDRQQDAMQARRLIDAGRVVDPDRLADPDVPIRAV